MASKRALSFVALQIPQGDVSHAVVIQRIAEYVDTVSATALAVLDAIANKETDKAASIAKQLVLPPDATEQAFVRALASNGVEPGLAAAILDKLNASGVTVMSADELAALAASANVP